MEGVKDMNMTEVARLLLGLRAAGWSEKDINDFMLYIESGEEQYKPKPKKDKNEQSDKCVAGAFDRILQRERSFSRSLFKPALSFTAACYYIYKYTPESSPSQTGNR